MRYRRLGHTGLRVAELCLGTMTFGNVTPPGEARSMFERYVERRGNFLDTAVNYADSASEQIVLRRLDRTSAVSLGYPHEFLAWIRAAYGPQYESVGSEQTR